VPELGVDGVGDVGEFAVGQVGEALEDVGGWGGVAFGD